MYVYGYLLSRLHRAAFMDTNRPKAEASDSPLIYPVFLLPIQSYIHIPFLDFILLRVNTVYPGDSPQTPFPANQYVYPAASNRTQEMLSRMPNISKHIIFQSFLLWEESKS